MNRKSAVLTLSIGIASAIVAVALALDLGGISSVLPIAAKGVWGFRGCAAALLVCGAFALAHKPTPQQIIEQGDERNAAINGKAGLRAFEAFSVLAPLAALALYAFEQISTAGRAHDHRRRGRSLDRLFRADRPHAADHVALAQDPALLSS